MMKRISVLFLTGIIVLVFSGISFGADYEYTTYAFSELDDDYAYAWKVDLGDDFKNDIDNGGTLSNVTLVFKDMQEFTRNDILYISVLDSDAVNDGIYNDYITHERTVWGWTYTYTTPDPGNYFDKDDDSAAELFTIQNVNSDSNDISITYNSNGLVEYIINDKSYNTADEAVSASFPLTTKSSDIIAALMNYSSNNVMTIGFDPDCYFDLSAGKISLILTTTSGFTGGGDPSHAPEPETLVLFGLGLLGASAFGRKRFS